MHRALHARRGGPRQARHHISEAAKPVGPDKRPGSQGAKYLSQRIHLANSVGDGHPDTRTARRLLAQLSA